MKTLIVTNCDNCPFKNNDTKSNYYCKKSNNILIVNPLEIPDWCDLKDGLIIKLDSKDIIPGVPDGGNIYKFEDISKLKPNNIAISTDYMGKILFNDDFTVNNRYHPDDNTDLFGKLKNINVYIEYGLKNDEIIIL